MLRLGQINTENAVLLHVLLLMSMVRGRAVEILYGLVPAVLECAVSHPVSETLNPAKASDLRKRQACEVLR